MDIKGLNKKEVLYRREQGQVNSVNEKITKTNGQIIQDNVFTIFNGFNFAIAVCLALVSAWVHMVYMLAIIVNTLTAIVQEMRAKNMVEHLTLISASKVKAVRDGAECELHVEEIVLDDTIILEMGAQICADSKVLQGEIEVNESLLTGEADPIVKKAGDTLLSGSFVVSGKCYAQVEHVGADNFAAKIVAKAKQHKKTKSELLGAITTITKFTGWFVAPVGIIMFIQSYVMSGSPLNESVIAAAAAVLGILPKGLVLLITVALVISVMRLSRKKILVQGLHSIEMFARVDMLCLDKTGTITEGKMSVAGCYPIGESAMSQTPEKAISCYIGAVDDNNSTFQAMKEHFGADESAEATNKIPFSSERKWGAVTLKNIGTLVLGAPEKLLASEQKLPVAVENAQKSGNRVLCLGFSEKPIENNDLSNIKPIAAIEISDPIRHNAKETLDFFKQEGVEVKIISGDNPITVSNVAKRAGLADYKNYIDMSSLDDKADINEVAKKYSIFGRVTPNQKKRLVEALKASGHTVGMTGDGVNDVLALKEADCSIAMASGSDAAKQVSQLVLLKSDFSSLTEVVMEGRRVINNATRFGSIFIIKTIFSFLFAIIGMVTFIPYPFLPIQITLYDAVIEGYFSFMLSFERRTERVSGRFLENIAKRGFPNGVLIIINILVISAIYPMLNLTSSEARTIMYFVTASISILASIRVCRPFNKYRLFVCSTVAFGFFTAAHLFKGLLELEWLSGTALIVFLSAIAVVIPLQFLLAFATEKIFHKRR